MTANYVTPYTNELGQTRYQPTLPSGERLFYLSIFRETLVWREPQAPLEPVLHKHAAKARRIAEREELRRRSVFREADAEGVTQ